MCKSLGQKLQMTFLVFLKALEDNFQDKEEIMKSKEQAFFFLSFERKPLKIMQLIIRIIPNLPRLT